MNQDWTLRGGNGKSPDTAKLQGHLALSMSNNLGIQRNTALIFGLNQLQPRPSVRDPSDFQQVSWPFSSVRFIVNSHLPLIVSKSAYAVAYLRNTHHHFKTPSFEIEGYCNPKLWDEVADTKSKMSQQKGKHTKTQQRSIILWNETQPNSSQTMLNKAKHITNEVLLWISKVWTLRGSIVRAQGLIEIFVLGGNG